MKKFIKQILGLVTLSLIMASCDTDDYTGDSVMTVDNTSVTITSEVTNATLIEDDSVFEFTATLSNPMPIDIRLYVTQVDGNATEGSDFEMSSYITVPAWSTTATGTIKILTDDLVEDTETVKIQIGDYRTGNTNFDPAFMEFTILNYTDGDLVVDMDWSIPYTTNDSGEEILATDFADLRLLLTNIPYTSILDGSDGGSFETYVLSASAPDGEYYIVADFFAANSDIIRDISLSSTFNQAGVINDMSFSFENALNNSNVCQQNYFILNKIIKSGTTYTIEEVGVQNFNTIKWNGGYDVIDYYGPNGWPSHIVTAKDCTGGSTISGLNKEWIENVWGETIMEEGTVYYTVDGSGNVTIDEQYIFTTDWNGSLYDYTVSGTGTINFETGELYLQYHLFQGGWSVDGYWYNAGGLDNPYFEANVTP